MCQSFMRQELIFGAFNPFMIGQCKEIISFGRCAMRGQFHCAIVFVRGCLDKRLQGLLVICIESLAILTNAQAGARAGTCKLSSHPGKRQRRFSFVRKLFATNVGYADWPLEVLMFVRSPVTVIRMWSEIVFDAEKDFRNHEKIR